MAAINYHKALDAVNVAVPMSVATKMAAVVWQVLTLVYIRWLCGAWFVRLTRRRTIHQCKDSVGPLEVAQVMFECQEVAMFQRSGFSLRRWHLALSAVNTTQVPPPPHTRTHTHTHTHTTHTHTHTHTCTHCVEVDCMYEASVSGVTV